MSFLNRLVDEHLRELSGAEFKVAAYLYRKLEKRLEVEMTIAELGSAAGVSAKQAYTVLLRLRNSGLIRVMSKRGHATRFSLPRVSPAPLLDRAPSAAPAPPRSPRAPRMPPAPPAEPAPKMNRGARSPAPNALTSKPHATPMAIPIAERIRPTATPALNPPPAAALSEEEQCRQLASELLGGQLIDDKIMASLNAAMEGHSPKPGALLRRLQEFQRRGKPARHSYQLAQGVKDYYWL